MSTRTPQTDLDQEFSSDTAQPTPWDEGIRLLESAGLYWISTVRPDGRPHVTPMMGIWLEDALYFCTGSEERKAKNLAANNQVVITTGCNSMEEGIDIVIEGKAVKLHDDGLLQRLAEQYKAKYEWDIVIRDGGFSGEGDDKVAPVFEVRPVTAFGFAKGERFAQTRWRFS